MDYVLEMVKASSQPFALSFFYANEDQINMNCNINMNSTGLESGWIDREAWVKRFKGRDCMTVFDGLYPTNIGRNLAINMVRCALMTRMCI